MQQIILSFIMALMPFFCFAAVPILKRDKAPVSHSLEISGEHGENILLIPSQDGTKFRVTLQGFPPHQKFRYLGDFSNHETMGVGTLSEAGSAEFEIEAKEGDGGRGALAVQLFDNREPMAIFFNWGNALR